MSPVFFFSLLNKGVRFACTQAKAQRSQEWTVKKERLLPTHLLVFPNQMSPRNLTHITNVLCAFRDNVAVNRLHALIHPYLYICIILFYFFKDLIYLFLETREGRKKGRETKMCGCLLHSPYCGPGLQPRHVP